MTLIVAAASRIGVVLLGDALITSSYSDYRDHPIPTLGLPNEHRSLGTRYVTGLARKIVRLSPQSAIAWSGDLSEVTPMLAALKKACSPGVHSRKYYDEIYRSIGIDKLTATTILIAQTKEGPHIGWTNVFKKVTEAIGIYVGGSGVIDFANDLAPALEGADPTAHDSMVLNQCGIMMASQSCLGHGLKAGFGGIFEVMAIDSHGLYEISDVLYVIRSWCCEEDPIRKNLVATGGVEEHGVVSFVTSVQYVSHFPEFLQVISFRDGGAIVHQFGEPGEKFTSIPLGNFQVTPKRVIHVHWELDTANFIAGEETTLAPYEIASNGTHVRCLAPPISCEYAEILRQSSKFK